MASPPALKRTIRFRDLTLFYVVCCLSIRWTAMAASAGPSILVVWVAALVCFFIPLAACVMELSSRHPQEGGLYVWTYEAFGEFTGFVAAWTYWMANLPFFPGILYFGAASALFAFGQHARGLAANPFYYVGFSIFWLAAITLLNIRGVNAGKWLNNVCVLGSLVPLTALFGLAAVSYVRFGAAIHFTPAGFIPHWTLDNAIFWSGVFFAFSGVETASAMGDEIQNPRRVIPWAILVGGCILAIGYIAGTAAFVVVLPSQLVAGPDGFVNGIRVLSTHLGVAWFLAPVAVLVAINAVGGAATNLSATSRLPFVAGIHSCLPAAFGSIQPRYRTPWVAIASYGLAGAFVTLLGQAGTSVRGAYQVLISMAVLASFVPYLFIFAAMIRLQSRPAAPAVRRVPGGRPVAIALASLGLASTVVTIVLSAFPAADEPNKPLAIAKVVGGSILLIGAGVTVFLVSKRRQPSPAHTPERALAD